MIRSKLFCLGTLTNKHTFLDIVNLLAFYELRANDMFCFVQDDTGTFKRKNVLYF